MSTPNADQTSEARRILTLCRVCGYCTGICPVFPALGRRLELRAADLDHLANLCHNCRACWYACQYAPPHPFAINVPATLARVRAASYRRYLWPRGLGGLIDRSPRANLALSLMLSLGVPLLTLLFVPPQRLFAAHLGAGAFYAVIPWGLMVTVATLSLGWSVLALTTGLVRFWRDTAPRRPVARPNPRRSLRRTMADILTLRHLDGGGAGCSDRDASPTPGRRLFHLILSYGFALCLASTIVAAFYHHLFGRAAPYPLLSAPVLLGSIGGLGMVIGVIGLWRIKWGADPAPSAPETLAAGHVLLGQLFTVAASGLLLLALRETPAMGLLLALHLGTVLALFVTLPYGELVHGAYRAVAIWRSVSEAQAGSRTGARPMVLMRTEKPKDRDTGERI